MNTPRNNKKFLAIPLIIAFATFAFLIANAFSSNKSDDPSYYKATINGPFRPLPLYGSNSINTRGPSWADKDFRDSAASMNLKIVRYPGGSFGDFWDWRKGWFIDNNNARLNNNLSMPAGYASMPYSPTGLKELKLLVDEANCDVLFELNMITSDINDQIEMLKNAQAMGFRIKWVELGNEFNLPKSAGRVKFQTARNYGTACYNWTKAIKESFPGVEVGVVGGNLQYSPDIKNWNDDVLNEATNVDAIVAHIYPVPSAVVDDDGINFENLYDAFQEDFKKMGFENVNNKKVWLTEYNIQWAYAKPGEDKAALQKSAFTWGQALAILLMTSESTSLPGSPNLILDHGIANWRGFASIEKRNNQVYMLPNGIGFRTWCEASRDKNSLRQISFQRSRHGDAHDYEVMGWQFKGDSGETSLIVNFTSKPIKIDATALNSNGKTFYNLKYADKNKTIDNWQDVRHEKRQINNNEINLPPYSIATL